MSSPMRTSFGMVPDWVDEQLTDGNTMRVYVRLVRKYANAERHAFPLIETLATELGVSESTVKRAVKTLRAIGAVQVSRTRLGDGSLGRNLYALPLDPPAQGPPVTGGAGQPGVTGELWARPAERGHNRRSEPGVKSDLSEKQLDLVKPDPSKTLSETPDGVTDESKICLEDDTPGRPDVVQLCNRLRDLMIQNGCKPPTVGKQWETAARLLLDRDKRDPREALWMIGWCQRDDFWRTNILSMPKFRAKYDQLVLRAKAEVGRRRNGLAAVGDGSGEPMVPVQVHRGGQRLVPARWFSVTSPPEDWDPARDPFDRVPGPDLPDWHWRRHNEQ